MSHARFTRIWHDSCCTQIGIRRNVRLVIYIVDQSGIVRLTLVDPNFTRRFDPSIIIARLKELKG